jgi:RNA polymerase primary sigma factor
MEKQELYSTVEDVINTLPRRVKTILLYRYGFKPMRYKKLTLENVRKMTKYKTRERIRQLESKGLKMLRHPQRVSIIKELLGRR